MNSHADGGWEKAFLSNCQHALYFGKDVSRMQGDESELRVGFLVGTRAFVKDDGSTENVSLDPNQLGGNFLVIFWERGAWRDQFHTFLPEGVFVGREPTKVEGSPVKWIALEKEKGERKTFYVGRGIWFKLGGWDAKIGECTEIC